MRIALFLPRPALVVSSGYHVDELDGGRMGDGLGYGYGYYGHGYGSTGGRGQQALLSWFNNTAMYCTVQYSTEYNTMGWITSFAGWISDFPLCSLGTLLDAV